MPCRWVTAAGRRVRLTGTVGAATMTTQIAAVTAAVIAGAIISVEIFHSPRVTPEEAREAGIRIWWNEERGYFAEARLHPHDPPIYTALTRDQARNLEGPEPDPSLIALVFNRREPADA